MWGLGRFSRYIRGFKRRPYNSFRACPCTSSCANQVFVYNCPFGDCSFSPFPRGPYGVFPFVLPDFAHSDNFRNRFSRWCYWIFRPSGGVPTRGWRVFESAARGRGTVCMAQGDVSRGMFIYCSISVPVKISHASFENMCIIALI